MAGREGFEPPEGSSPSTVFKTAAIDHSAISRYFKVAKKENKIVSNSFYKVNDNFMDSKISLKNF